MVVCQAELLCLQMLIKFDGDQNWEGDFHKVTDKGKFAQEERCLQIEGENKESTLPFFLAGFVLKERQAEAVHLLRTFTPSILLLRMRWDIFPVCHLKDLICQINEMVLFPWTKKLRFNKGLYAVFLLFGPSAKLVSQHSAAFQATVLVLTR